MERAKFALQYITFVLLLSLVRCPVIKNPLALIMDKPDQHTMKQKSNYFKDISHRDDVNSDDQYPITTAPGGLGIYRDPLEVLGPKFPPSIIISLCELNLYMYADIVSKVQFTWKGSQLCDEVCRQYHMNMIFDGPVDVTVLQGYCDYTGVAPDGRNAPNCTESDLSTSCTCAYKVRCSQRTKVIMYTFQTNCEGFMKVSVTESNQMQCIT